MFYIDVLFFFFLLTVPEKHYNNWSILNLVEDLVAV